MKTARSVGMRGMLIGAMLMAAGLYAGAGSATAGEMVWKFKSEHPNSVGVELYSQDRNKTWPGGGRPYVLRDWKTHEFQIDCQEAERICFGAWVQNDTSTFWGAGLDGVEACSNCCAKCGSKGLRTQVLKP